MPKIHFVEPGGGVRTVESPAGQSVMRAAVDHGMPGIRAECGGACACATCPVLVDPAWMARIPPPGATEASMLDGDGPERGMTRRLSCQIEVTPGLDGLVVHLLQGF